MRKPGAYVTGADRGLGLGLTEALLERGFQVFAGEFGVDPTGLAALAARHGEALQRVPLDIGSARSVWHAADRVRQGCDALEVLINSAGILGDFTATLADPLDFDQMQEVFNVNALGPLRVTQSVLTHLAKGQRKKLVNISSEAGSMQQSETIHRTARYGYCMSKAALNVQSVIAANQVRAQGIEVYLIDPGGMRTYMFGQKNPHAELEPEEAAARILATVLDRPHPGYLYMTNEGESYPW